jgi:hypothetical protein
MGNEAKTKEEISYEKNMQRLRDILLSHRGKDNSITATAIAKYFDIDDGDTRVVTRRMIKDCAYMFHIPLAGGPNGYFVITNISEMEEYSHNLSERANEIERRRQDIYTFYNEQNELTV